MANREKGISAIKLIFMVLILAVIIAGIVFVVKRLWQDNSVKDIGTDLLYIKAKCKIIHDKNIIDSNEQLLGQKITEYTENGEVNGIISQNDKWYKLSQGDLEKIGIGELKEEDGYLVNYEEEDVIFAKGILENEQTYYKLSDLERVREEKEKEKQEKQANKEAEEKAKEEQENKETEKNENSENVEQPQQQEEAVQQTQTKELIAEATAPEELPVPEEQTKEPEVGEQTPAPETGEQQQVPQPQV